MPSPTTTNSTSSVGQSGTDYINALISGVKWGGTTGSGTSLSYSFPWTSSGTATFSGPNGVGQYSALNEQNASYHFGLSTIQQAAARDAMQSWADVANIVFTEVADTSTNVGDIRFGWTSASQPQAWGWASYPSSYWPSGGDVWISTMNSSNATNSWEMGSVNFYALIHELGHALGLKHPFDGTPVLPSSLDNELYTVMSYTDSLHNIYPSAGYVDGIYSWISYSVQPETPMVLDIAAIQYLYGANISYHTGNDTYTFDNTKPFFKTIWDADGTDTISVSNFTLSCVIDLTPGSYSSLKIPPPSNTGGVTPTYDGTNNLGIAYGCIIENAVGGSGNDTLIGNDANNSLNGAGGSDTLIGGAGNDTLDGGVALDRIRGTDYNSTNYDSATSGININLSGISGDGSTGSGTASGDASVGVDTLMNISLIRGTNFDDTILGSTALIFEQFEGGAGNDTLDGGAITDTLNSDNGNRVSYQNAIGAGVTLDFIAGTAIGNTGSNIGSDLLVNFNQVQGSNLDDTLFGSNRTDIAEIYEGRAGNDTIDGRGGFDIVRYDSATAGVTVNLVTGRATGAVGTDTLLNIEGVFGSTFDDILLGGNAANGVTVNDGLSELFRGGAGNDTIDGGRGLDRVDYTSSTARVTVVLNDTLDGSASDGLGGTDVLRNIEAVQGSAFADSLTGSNSAALEFFDGREGNDTINGLGGIDLADYRTSRAGVTVNLATGVAFDGYGGTDTLLNIENVRGSRDFGDLITGSAVNNVLEGLGGDDLLIGGTGIDTSLYQINRSLSTLTKTTTGFIVSSSTDGSDTLVSIERLAFTDTSVALDITGNAGTTAKIIGAVFGQASVANKGYVGIGLNLLDGGMSYQDLMLLALNAKLGSGFSIASEVTLLYQNLAGVAPSADNLSFWTNAINTGQYTQASLGVMAADYSLNTNNINLVGLAQTGIEYTV